MKVSIIIPVYNVEQFITNCLNSVFSQTYNNLEIVIVNDNTEDNSMRIIEDYIKNNKKRYEIKIINHTENKGLSAARNTGIKNATGDYLFFLDSDDEITPKGIELLANFAEDNNLDVAIGEYITTSPDPDIPHLNFKDREIIRGSKKILNSYAKNYIYVMAWNKLIKKEFLLHHNLFFKDRLIHEDCLWSFQMVCQAENIGFIKQDTYIYKIRNGSIMTSISIEEDITEYTTVLKSMVEYVIDNHLINNKYIYHFLEEEKQRLYRTSNADGKVYERAESLYRLFRSFPRPHLVYIFMWNILKSKKCIRDAHYFLPFATGLEYYTRIPHFLSRRSHNNNKIRFYKWFLKTIFQRILFSKELSLPQLR